MSNKLYLDIIKIVKRIFKRKSIVEWDPSMRESAYFFICNLRYIIDDKVFKCKNIRELGNYYISLIESKYIGISLKSIEDLVRIKAYKEEYDLGTNICLINGFSDSLLPKESLKLIKRKFKKLASEYNNTLQNMNLFLEDCNQRQKIIIKKIKALETKSRKPKLDINIKNDEVYLANLNLEKNKIRTELETVKFAQFMLRKQMSELCDFDKINSIDEMLRKEAVSYSTKVEKRDYIVFDVYNRFVEIAQESVSFPENNPMVVKLLPLHYELYPKISKRVFEKLTEFDYTKDISKEEFSEICAEEEKNIPQLRDLIKIKRDNLHLYVDRLQTMIDDFDMVEKSKQIINSTFCLRKHKDILLSSIEMFQNHNYMIFINCIAIQIEGVFYDYLSDVSLFSKFSKMISFDDATLKEKIEAIQITGCQPYPEVIEYFQFYFNNLIRNKIAHGHTELVDNSDKMAALAYELFLDLYSLIYMINKTSDYEHLHRLLVCVSKIESIDQKKEVILNYLNRNRVTTAYNASYKYQAIKVLYWLCNPYYESIIGEMGLKNELMSIRSILYSADFWNYALDELNIHPLNVNNEFSSVIKCFLRQNLDDNLKKAIIEVNKKQY